jgi:hypothetical protein
MPSARGTLIDISSVTVLGLCPHCAHREFGYEEAAVRRGLLAHFYSHDHSAIGPARDSVRRWFQRKGITA